MLCLNNKMIIQVGARGSPLSQAQVKEVLQALQHYHPHVEFDVQYMSTIGDRDQTTSLRTLDRTDFFTKDIDLAVLEGRCHLGIHSAKDLPIPLPPGLSLLCLTRGVDAADSLVLKPHVTLDQLPAGACIATSSLRREESVKQLRTDLTFCDIRGTIEQRLVQLNTNTGKIEGVVIAEAALIRLRLTHLNRIRLPGITVEGQGQLAVVGRVNDQEMKIIFSCLDSRIDLFRN